jgi:hypothetical protein
MISHAARSLQLSAQRDGAEVLPVDRLARLGQEQGSTMRKLLLAGAAFGCLMMGPQAAKADVPIYNFSGAGTSGNLFGTPSSIDELWQYTHGTSQHPYPNSNTDIGWGSPGIGGNFDTYGRSIPATDFQITFGSSVTLDPDQIPVGDATGCVPNASGGSTGGTVFCAGSTPWTIASFTTNSITFDAPATGPGSSLHHGDNYFVDIFLEGTSGASFTGDWSGVPAPEPASLSMLGAGLLALGWARRRPK